MVFPPLIFPKKEAMITKGNSSSIMITKTKKPYIEKAACNKKRMVRI